nr:MAG TPA: hypothetical protein [Caudoviricetes sp.]
MAILFCSGIIFSFLTCHLQYRAVIPCRRKTLRLSVSTNK